MDCRYNQVSSLLSCLLKQWNSDTKLQQNTATAALLGVVRGMYFVIMTIHPETWGALLILVVYLGHRNCTERLALKEKYIERVFSKHHWGNLTDDKLPKMVQSKCPQTTQNRQLHAKQEVGQLYFIIHNNIIYFWEIEWISIQSLINHPILEFPYKVFIYV